MAQEITKKNHWKTVAVIFIIVSIFEFGFILYAFNLGIDLIEEENECGINICADEYYDAYFYDNAGTCYCYKDGEIVYQEYLR